MPRKFFSSIRIFDQYRTQKQAYALRGDKKGHPSRHLFGCKMPISPILHTAYWPQYVEVVSHAMIPGARQTHGHSR